LSSDVHNEGSDEVFCPLATKVNWQLSVDVRSDDLINFFFGHLLDGGSVVVSQVSWNKSADDRSFEDFKRMRLFLG
jgi:hypothetical protein